MKGRHKFLEYKVVFLSAFFLFALLVINVVLAQEGSDNATVGTGIAGRPEKTITEPVPGWIINKSNNYIKSFVGDDYFNQRLTLSGNTSFLSGDKILYNVFYLYDVPSDYLASPGPKYVSVSLDKDGNILDYLGPKKSHSFSTTREQAIDVGKQKGLKEPIAAEIDRVLTSNSADGYVWVVTGAVDQETCRDIGGTQECLIPGVYVDIDDGSFLGTFSGSTLIREPGSTPPIIPQASNNSVIIISGIVILLVGVFLVWYKFYRKK